MTISLYERSPLPAQARIKAKMLKIMLREIRRQAPRLTSRERMEYARQQVDLALAREQEKQAKEISHGN